MEINTIILDLGGVLLNLDFGKSENAFSALGINYSPELYIQLQTAQLFTDFETGRISSESFIRDLKTMSDKNLSDGQVINAWNAMLLDFPPERITLLKKIRSRYRLFLLSNTNALHVTAFNQKLKEVFGISSLDVLFDGVYYSHLIGERKPDVEAYEAVIKENDLNPSMTLFIDDNQVNVDGAEKAGLHAIRLKAPESINGLMERVYYL